MYRNVGIVQGAEGDCLLRRRSLQYALGLETVLLVALFALYARYNRQAQELEMDEDEVGSPS